MCSCTRIEPQGSLPRRGPETSIFWQRIYCSSFLSCVSVYRKFFIHSVAHNYSKERHCTMGKVVPYKRLKTVENYKTVRGKFGVLDRLSLMWEVVAYERWSDMEVQMKYLCSQLS